jgi:hypothetical protein
MEVVFPMITIREWDFSGNAEKNPPFWGRVPHRGLWYVDFSKQVANLKHLRSHCVFFGESGLKSCFR